MTDLLTDTGASFSVCKQYRYRLWRTWDTNNRSVMFLMLNPSTADETANDPTVERCQRYAMNWGYGGLVVCNIFALRSTDPGALYKHDEPIGASNDDAILTEALTAGIVVCAWGNHGQHLGRGRQVAEMLDRYGINLYALTLTGLGQPGHPLYLRKDLEPFIWKQVENKNNV